MANVDILNITCPNNCLVWEEVAGSSFFTIQASHRALVQGSQIAARIGEECASCESQAPEAGCFLASSVFWNSTGGHIVSNVNTGAGFSRSGIDADYLLGVSHRQARASDHPTDSAAVH